MDAMKIIHREPERALRRMSDCRRRLWRDKWRAEAFDVALAELAIAQLTLQSGHATRLSRWLVDRLPSGDTFLIHGDMLCKSGHPTGARRAWNRAVLVATKEGKPSIARLAQHRLTKNEVDDRPTELSVTIGQARGLAETDLDGALKLLFVERRKLLRRNGRGDATQLLRISVSLCERRGEIRRAKRLAERLSVEEPTAVSFRLLASLELELGHWARADELSRRAVRKARREGALTEARRAAEIRGRVRAYKLGSPAGSVA